MPSLPEDAKSTQPSPLPAATIEVSRDSKSIGPELWSGSVNNTPGRYQLGGEPVPGYRLTQFLGKGGFGEVWKAVAPGGTEAAFKIINLSGKQGLKEFRALRLVKRVRHPNLIPIVAFWLKDEQGHLLADAEALFAEMDKRSGQMSADEGPRPAELLIAMGLGERDLGHRLEECKREGLSGIPPHELLRYMEDVARALDYLNSPRHGEGPERVAIQHCDIKPFNIMIVGGAAQVCDFGLARMLGDIRKTASTMGTMAYVAPECLTQHEPSATSDQYSLAITYFELRTSRLPYRSELFAEVIDAVLKGNLDLSALPGAEAAVIRRATALDPKKRYASNSDLVQALDQAVNANDETLRVAHPAQRSRALLAVVVAALLAGGALLSWQPWRAATVVPALDPATAGLLAQAEHEFKASQFAQAIKTLSEAIDQAPLPPAQAYLLRGTCYLEQQALEPADEDFSTAIRLNPNDARAFSRRATCRLRAGNVAEAVNDFSAAIRIHSDVRDLVGRGVAHWNLAQLDQADDDLSQAIQREPNADDVFDTYYKRALVRVDLKRFPDAARDFAAALQRAPADAVEVVASYAWLLATAPEPALRDGQQAVVLAQRACALASTAEHLDILAAAYAEAGEFSDAVATAKQAVQQAEDDTLKDEYASRLKLYQQNRPYRELP